MRRLTAKPECVRAVAFLPDGRLASASGKKQVTIWNPADGSVSETIRTRMFVFAIAVSATRNEAAFAGRGAPSDTHSTIQLHHLVGPHDRYELAWRIQGYPTRDTRTRSIWSLAYTGDGEHLIAARRVMGGGGMYDGGDCRWWDRRKVFDSAELAGQPRGYAVAADTSGSRFAVAEYSQFLVYDHPAVPPAETHPFSNHWASAVCFLPDGEVMIGSGQFLLSSDRHTRTGRLSRQKTDVRMIRTLAVSPTGHVLAVGGSPGRVELLDLPSRRLMTAYDFDLGPVQSLAFAPDGLTLAVGAEKGLIVVDVE